MSINSESIRRFVSDQPVPIKTIERDAIAAQVAAYLERGGRIEQVETGVINSKYFGEIKQDYNQKIRASNASRKAKRQRGEI